MMSVETNPKEQAPTDNQTPTWSALVIIAIISQVFWWCAFASPFLELFKRLIAAIEKLANM
jgi:hypothetical protein